MTRKESILSETCSYLGFRNDPSSLTAYPSSMNCCHKCQPRATPALAHQREFCLSREHVTCLVFQTAESEKMPRELIFNNGRSLKSSPSVGWGWIIGLLVIVMTGLTTSFYYFNQLPTKPEWIPPQTFTPNSIPTLAPIAKTDTVENTVIPAQSTSTLTLAPTISQPSLTPTDFPPQIHALDVPVLVGEQPILLHRVVEGEQLVLLTKHHKTTIEVLQALNTVPVMPLYANKVIVIAPGLLVADPNLPSFEPYQVTDQEIGIEDLAAKMRVDPALLKYYNRCSSACSLVKGDWLLVPPPIPTPTPTPTPLPSPTPTSLAPQAHTFDAPIMIGVQPILLHRVIEGEQIVLIAKYNQTTVEVLQAINYIPPAPVYAGQVIVIAPGLQVVDPQLPAFEPFQVTDSSISIDDLVLKLGVDLTLLKYYNGCQDGCQLVKGDWLLIPRVK